MPGLRSHSTLAELGLDCKSTDSWPSAVGTTCRRNPTALHAPTQSGDTSECKIPDCKPPILSASRGDPWSAALPPRPSLPWLNPSVFTSHLRLTSSESLALTVPLPTAQGPGSSSSILLMALVTFFRSILICIFPCLMPGSRSDPGAPGARE